MKYLYTPTFIFTILLLFSGCATQRGDFYMACEINSVNNYEIRWESIGGSDDENIKVFRFMYPSFNRSDFKTPNYELSIKDGRLVVQNDRKSRSYFCFEFSDGYVDVVSTRFQYFPGVKRSRDIGGYRTTTGEQVRWGMVYPTSDIKQIESLGIDRMNMLGLKTLINLDEGVKNDRYSDRLPFKNYIFFRTENMGYDLLISKMERQMAQVDDAIIYLNSTIQHLIVNESSQISQMMRVFANINNYPIVICSTELKEKSEFVIALLMSYLGVPKESIVESYLLNNKYRSIDTYSLYSPLLDQGGQEALTYLLSAKSATIDMMFRVVNSNFGSVDKYIREELKLTESELNSIRENMLYKL
ncbi:MAG: tyrosine-protein phosphatase [Bacteroidales bacterium]